MHFFSDTSSYSIGYLLDFYFCHLHGVLVFDCRFKGSSGVCVLPNRSQVRPTTLLHNFSNGKRAENDFLGLLFFAGYIFRCLLVVTTRLLRY